MSIFRTYRWFLLGLMVAYVLCLMPAPSFWQEHFPWLTGRLDTSGSGSPFLGWLRDHSDLRDWSAHLLLMAGISFEFIRIEQRRRKFKFSNFSSLKLALFTLGLVAVVAISIEWFQSLLPEIFSRGSALSDVWASLIGGVIGICLGLRFGHSRRFSHEGAQEAQRETAMGEPLTPGGR